MRPEKQNPDVSLLTEGVLFFGTYGDSRSEKAHCAIELAWRPPRGRLRRCASDIELAWQPYYSATLLLFSKPPYHPAWTSHRNTIRRNGTRDNASCSDYAVFSLLSPREAEYSLRQSRHYPQSGPAVQMFGKTFLSLYFQNSDVPAASQDDQPYKSAHSKRSERRSRPQSLCHPQKYSSY